MTASHAAPPPPPDQASRDRIVLDLDTCLLVEAAAGTGKTTCMIARMIAVLRSGRARIDQIAAVTFTRKAAAEIRSRFQLDLEGALSSAEGQSRTRLAAALAHIDHCFIGTIHAFCARLLRERPVEAGVDISFAELDENEDYRLREQAWREHVATMIAEDDAVLPELETLGLKVIARTRNVASLLAELEEMGLEAAQLGQTFLTLTDYPDVDDWPAPPRELPDPAPATAALREFMDYARKRKLADDPGRDKLMPKLEQLQRLMRYRDLKQPPQLMEVLELFSSMKRTSIVQKNWPEGKDVAVQTLDKWNHFTATHAEPLLDAWRQRRYHFVMRAMRPAGDIYDRLRQQRNALNFQDLLLKSAELLRSHPSVRRYFQQRFTHLLVDEFQDTDPLQAEVMFLLTADDVNERQWQRCRPRPGALFVVGDPKQSIYRFRRADIVIYNRVRERIEETGGAVVPLTANFRSLPAVIDWINGCFDTMFPAAATDVQPENRRLDVGLAQATSPAQPVLQRLDAPSHMKSQEVIAEYEADRIARYIRGALDQCLTLPRTSRQLQQGWPEHVVPGDFLIVARIKARLAIYARHLLLHGIPHHVTGGSVLNEAPELRLLHVCLHAIARPDDGLALVAALRSELFGISNSTLFALQQAGGRFHFLSPLPPALPTTHADLLADAFGRMKQYWQWLKTLPTISALERIAAETGLLARACAADGGKSRPGSLLKAIELLRAEQQTHTTGDLVDALSRLVEKTDTHDGLPVRSIEENAVRLMNLHQCKGLEAPIVFLVDPSGAKDWEPQFAIDRSGTQTLGYLPVRAVKTGNWSAERLLAHPPDWPTKAALESQFLDAEESRLLYVAATRAGCRLIISQRGHYTNKDSNPWYRFRPFLEQAPQLEDIPATASAPHVGSKPDARLPDARDVAARWKRALRPSYQWQAAKETSLVGGGKPKGSGPGGAAWGTMIHVLLETASRNPDRQLRPLALSLLEQNGLALSLVDEVLRTVDAVCRANVWSRAVAAPRKLVEFPFAVRRVNPDVAATQTYVRGVMDLVFEEPQGWVLVDYKSERVTKAELPALVDYYRPQLDAYAWAWQQLTGQPVCETGLLFTHLAEYVALKPDTKS